MIDETTIKEFFRGSRGALSDPVWQWRLFCYRQGQQFADYVEQHFFSLAGQQMLDCACAWGGHAIAFAQRNCQVIASDLKDHQFSRLALFAFQNGFALKPLRSDCQRLPFARESFALVMALELIEHIPDVKLFAEEVSRVLRPGGICLLSTPARLRAVYEGEPHYGLRGLALLPFAWQQGVATNLFRKKYPYPIFRQFGRAETIIRPFAEAGLDGYPVLSGKLGLLTSRIPLLKKAARTYCWNFLVLQKPATTD